MDPRITPAVIAAAQAGQRAYFVPTSVSIAQWAVESAWGLAMPPGSNNPFGIKAKPGEPSVAAMTREVIGGVSQHLSQPFRKFGSLAEAFEGHAKLLATVSLYAPAMLRWKAGDLPGGVTLMAQHYATDPKYAETIMSVINANGLAALDRQVALETASTKAKAAIVATVVTAPSAVAAGTAVGHAIAIGAASPAVTGFGVLTAFVAAFSALFQWRAGKAASQHQAMAKA